MPVCRCVFGECYTQSLEADVCTPAMKGPINDNNNPWFQAFVAKLGNKEKEEERPLHTIMKLVCQKGWNWSDHVKPGAGTDLCQKQHLGFIRFGSMVVALDLPKNKDGSQMTIHDCKKADGSWNLDDENAEEDKPKCTMVVGPQAYHFPPNHDGFAVTDCEIYEFNEDSAKSYARDGEEGKEGNCADDNDPIVFQNQMKDGERVNVKKVMGSDWADKVNTVEVMNLNDNMVMYLDIAAGWKWSECIKPTLVGTPDEGKDWCQKTHMGVVISGSLEATLYDPEDPTKVLSTITAKAGDVYCMGPHHEGFSPDGCIAVEFAGAWPSAVPAKK